MLRIQITTIFLVFTVFSSLAQNIEIQNSSQLMQEIGTAQPGQVFLLGKGDYANIQLIVEASGTAALPIIIRAKEPGQVVFSGDVKVELRGDHIQLEGIYFKDGNRNETEWSSHGPGLVAIYGSHNRITQCAFHCFDQANSAYITTSIPESGKVPQYCRIDHCSFTEKITFDQVINLNNTLKKTDEGEPGIPMYHRIDHCFFANPKKPGNAGGGIRVGYWRKDHGRCLVDSNLFMRQDSEPEIITSKSRENVYYANTFLNCRGTLNFRHGDKQVAINNFFISSDARFEYGGMFVWGSEHLIAANHFELSRTIASRGGAALYLNPGARATEHALAYNLLICNNSFGSINGYAIHFHPLYDRRIAACQKSGQKFELPTDIRIHNNSFVGGSSQPLFKNDYEDVVTVDWKHNASTTSNYGFSVGSGIDVQQMEQINDVQSHKVYTPDRSFEVEGIPIHVFDNARTFIQGEPLTWDEVGPGWLTEMPGTYAKTGRLAKDVQQRFKEVINKRR